jgi:hypothetical protein
LTKTGDEGHYRRYEKRVFFSLSSRDFCSLTPIFVTNSNLLGKQSADGDTSVLNEVAVFPGSRDDPGARYPTLKPIPSTKFLLMFLSAVKKEFMSILIKMNTRITRKRFRF